MNIRQTVNLILRAVGVGMGVAVVVLNVLNDLRIDTALTLLGIGLACVSISLLPDSAKDKKKNS